MDEDAIRTVVRRLSRPHADGGTVIERAAIIAEGSESGAIIAWIVAHAGIPEAPLAAAPRRGLHGSWLADSGGADRRAPRRYVLPSDVTVEHQAGD